VLYVSDGPELGQNAVENAIRKKPAPPEKPHGAPSPGRADGYRVEAYGTRIII